MEKCFQKCWNNSYCTERTGVSTCAEKNFVTKVQTYCAGFLRKKGITHVILESFSTEFKNEIEYEYEVQV